MLSKHVLLLLRGGVGERCSSEAMGQLQNGRDFVVMLLLEGNVVRHDKGGEWMWSEYLTIRAFYGLLSLLTSLESNKTKALRLSPGPLVDSNPAVQDVAELGKRVQEIPISYIGITSLDSREGESNCFRIKHHALPLIA